MADAEKRADAEKCAVRDRFDDPMAHYMSSVHASDAHPMLEDVDDDPHAVSNSSRSKRTSDDHDDRKHKRHKHKHHKHKHHKHRNKSGETHKETHKHKKSRRAEKDKQRSRPDARISSNSSDRGSDGSNRSSTKPDRSSSPDIGPPLPSTEPEIGPPMPPPGAALDASEKTDYRPTHEAFSSLGAAWAKEGSRLTQPRDGANHGASAAARVLRCLVCGVDSSGEATFMQHLCGSRHKGVNQGCTGFAGLAPNSTGRIPPLVNEVLRAAAIRLGVDPDGSSGPSDGSAAAEAATEPPLPPWAPPSRSVHLSAKVEAEVTLALAAPTAPSASSLSASASLGSGAPTEDPLARLYQSKGVATAATAQGPQGPQPTGGAAATSARAPPPPAARRRALPPPPRVVAGGGPCAAVRQSLPVAHARAELLAALAEPACIVEGETGSGKTTQVPQFVLEAAAERGARVNVIVTQPRRISAIGVADRVATERGERVGSGAVGYAVRGESRQCADTCLLFCTTGVLLRMLEEDTHLAAVTHVLVDEVRQRSPKECRLHASRAQQCRLASPRGIAISRTRLQACVHPLPYEARPCMCVHALAVPGTRAYRRGRLPDAHAA